MPTFDHLNIEITIRVSEDDAYWRHETTAADNLHLDLPLQLFDAKKFSEVVNSLVKETLLQYNANVKKQEEEIAKATRAANALTKEAFRPEVIGTTQPDTLRLGDLSQESED